MGKRARRGRVAAAKATRPVPMKAQLLRTSRLADRHADDMSQPGRQQHPTDADHADQHADEERSDGGEDEFRKIHWRPVASPNASSWHGAIA
jgi:hypothetical protein